MDFWVRAHLMVNHFPIMLGLVAAAAVLAALATRREFFWLYAYVTAILGGVSACFAYFTGDQAGDIARHYWYVNRPEIHDHEDAALWTLLILIAAGLAAIWALYRRHPRVRAIFSVLVLAGAVSAAITGWEGGKIVHESPKLLPRVRPDTTAPVAPSTPGSGSESALPPASVPGAATPVGSG